MKRGVGGHSGESEGWTARLVVGTVVLWLGDDVQDTKSVVQ